MRFLYVFAGAERKASITYFLEQLMDKAVFSEVVATELDLIRGPQFDVLDSEVQADILRDVEFGSFDAIMLSPPCSTFSRARVAKQTRLAQSPFGIVNIRGAFPGCRKA